ncbi:helix-turn-helix transcriptional regulator [Nesterenkonia sp. E16_7]|uniref:helix-turn-helix domain-containing protein n=1 Tax=unclassified Nesterenkonia TaxID=2629769 RepID=UPI001A921BD9|nr:MULTISPECIES: helix-turn-helix transcriptional regulator [unclassified Nesterenkonia]MBO0596470.1 helix-turn-helix transcriptional regulator [Nesterenkonia sp. E16_10]MBO0597302.1 helix-turn-helix transcriptional regulator [Nesterenkonia sp. E16_7]
MTDELESARTLRHSLSRDHLEELRFREALNSLRREQDMSQGELARRMVEEGWEQFNQATVSRIEKGTRPVRLGEARALARVLGTEVGYMLSDSGPSRFLTEFWDVYREALNHQSYMQAAVRSWSDSVARLRYLLSVMDLDAVQSLLPRENQLAFEAAVASARRLTQRDIGQLARDTQWAQENPQERPEHDEED